MSDIREMGPARETVTIRGQAYEMRGLSFRMVRDLLVRYPDLAALLAGEVNVGALMLHAPHAAAAIIAGGLGKWGDEATEAWIDDLEWWAQMALLAPVVDLTIGEDAGPLLAALERMGLMGERVIAASRRMAPKGPPPTPSKRSGKRSKS